MPTGTGKTDTMVALFAASCPKRLFVLVPSDTLQTQIAEKFEQLGILPTTGTLGNKPPAFPVIARLATGLTNVNTTQAFTHGSNIVATTPHALNAGNEKTRFTSTAESETSFVDEAHRPVDPGSEAHDLVMALFGGMSKEERSRIRTRVRAAMSTQAAEEGRFLGGRPPYGYRLVDARLHPNSEKAAYGQWLHRLEPDPVTAPVVQRIFAAFLAGKGYYPIAEELTAEGIPSPSAHDQVRNAHRPGFDWGKSSVRTILLNPRYTGYQVWGRQHRNEVLLDIADMSAGYQTVQRWNTSDPWV